MPQFVITYGKHEGELLLSAKIFVLLKHGLLYSGTSI